MGTYTIGEVAERSGFSTSALRYYEGIGLVAPSTRSDGGYRIYDDDTLDRLAFVARAKELGCTLDEIGDLLGILDGEQCAPVQRRLHDLVTTKIAAAQRQVAGATEMADRLEAAASLLAGEPADGPCSEGCACVAPSPARDVGAGPGPAPIACTLEAAEVPGRRQAWSSLLGRARARSGADDGAVRFSFDAADAGLLEELVPLVAAEQACCSFFAFTITVDAGGIGLEVRAPQEAAGIMADLLGQPA